LLDGGAGIDSIRFGPYQYFRPLVLSAHDLATGTVTLPGGAQVTGIEAFDFVYGSRMGDTIVGGDFGDTVSGENGDDRLSGGGGNDRMYGKSGDDQLSGGAGDDILVARGGRDTLQGGDGDDTLYLYRDFSTDAIGAHRLEGGAGNDVYELRGGGESVLVEAPDGGVDTVRVCFHDVLGSFTLGPNIENLKLDNFWTTGVGNALANVIQGSRGSNNLYGLDGDDSLRGNGHDDLLSGDDGNDLLEGRLGEDSLYGGAGADTLKVGRDAVPDLVLFAEADSGADRVLNFDATLDRVSLSLDAYPGLAATGAFDSAMFRAGRGVDAALAPTDRLLYDTATGALYYDADGSGGVSAPGLVATFGLYRHPHLTADNFIVG
jgi:serralysin